MTYPMDSIPDNVNYLKKLIDSNKQTLKVVDTYYGDQNRIPRTPSVCIEPGDKMRELNGLPRRTQTTITTYVMIYHNPVTQTTVIREEDDKLAEAIEALIHQDAQWKDDEGVSQVTDSLVRQIESGYVQKSGALFRCSRLTVEANMVAQLPSSAV